MIPGITPPNIVDDLARQMNKYVEKFGPGAILWTKTLFGQGVVDLLGQTKVFHFRTSEETKKQPRTSTGEKLAAKKTFYPHIYTLTQTQLDDLEPILKGLEQCGLKVFRPNLAMGRGLLTASLAVDGAEARGVGSPNLFNAATKY